MNTLHKTYKLLFKGILYDPFILGKFLIQHIVPTSAVKVKELSDEDIVTAIKAGKSIIRLGDGEMLTLTGRDIYFQTATRKLQKSLYQLIDHYQPDSPYLLGVPVKQLAISQQEMSGRDLKIWRLYRSYFPTRFDTSQSYLPLTWFYVQGVFDTHVRPLLKDKHVIFISNSTVLDANLRQYAQKYFAMSSFIEVPSKNADKQSSATISAIEQTLASSQLSCVVVFAAGPALKAIAADFLLEKNNPVQFLDIGHGLSLVAHPERDRSYKA